MTALFQLTDSLKMLRETLCVAQTDINRSGRFDEEARAHADRLGRLIDEIDRQRPLASNGKHGNLHTATCGCEDKHDWRNEIDTALVERNHLDVFEPGVCERKGCGHYAYIHDPKCVCGCPKALNHTENQR
jgi:hypothetical protein